MNLVWLKNEIAHAIQGKKNECGKRGFDSFAKPVTQNLRKIFT